MAIKVLLDSVILIDHFNGVSKARAYLRELRGEAAISVITWAEVLTGFDGPDREIPRRLLNTFHTFSIDSDTADLAATLRRTHRWRLPDALQAAVAQLNRLRLATRNTRDFSPDQFDFVVVPYSLSRR